MVPFFNGAYPSMAVRLFGNWWWWWWWIWCRGTCGTVPVGGRIGVSRLACAKLGTRDTGVWDGPGWLDRIGGDLAVVLSRLMSTVLVVLLIRSTCRVTGSSRAGAIE